MKFPFFSRPSLKIVESDWNLYSYQDEFEKYFKNSDGKLDNDWRISEVNKDYAVKKSFIIIIIID